MDENAERLEPADHVGDLENTASIDALWHSLHCEIRRRGPDGNLADDVAQETWLRALRRQPENRFLKPWLRIVGCVCWPGS
jgi:DNA-directed RNA polymerase specialized sigma24 family protein